MSLWKELYKRGKSHVLHELERVLGNANAGRLLSQLIYWYSEGKDGAMRARVVHEDKVWVAFTREEWCADTGLTEWRLRDAISVLEQKGLIERKMFKYQRAMVRHIHLDMEAVIILIAENDAREELQNEQTSQGGCENLTGGVRKSHPYYKPRDLEEIYTAPEKPPGLQKYESQHPSLITGKDQTSKPTPDAIMKDVSTLKGFKLPEKTSKELKEGVGILSLYWKKRMAEYTGGYVKPLVGKQIGELKYLLRDLGMELAMKLIAFAFDNWAPFVVKVKIVKGVHNAPEQPATWFLHVHHDVLMQLIAQKNPPTKSSGSPSKPKPVTIPSTTLVTKKPIVKTDPKVLADLIAKMEAGESLED